LGQLYGLTTTAMKVYNSTSNIASWST